VLGGALLQLSSGALVVPCGGLSLELSPLLTLMSRAPDRGWAWIGPPETWFGPPRQLVAWRGGPDAVFARYRDDGESVLVIRPLAADAGLEVEAFSRLPAPIFTHQNSFASLVIRGHRRLTLSFSPAPQERVEPLPFDYPAGRPLRLGYLDGAGRFHVAEASNGEKGPFSELAAGRLGSDAPLGITLYDEGAPACRVTLDDFARQADTQPSPTAGWGLPANDISFSRDEGGPDAAVRLFATLAATGTGRGIDTVGHAAGTYRNRVRVEPLR
jgi:hypothetical protein